MSPEPAGRTGLTAAREIARRIGALDHGAFPDAVLDHAALCVLDLLGAALSGFGQDSARSARAFAGEFFPPGPAGIWFTPQRASIAGAAFVNAAAASALDLDDGHRAAGGHPGASIIPAALAVAQSVKSSGKEFLAALVIGYEVSVRAAAARDLTALDTFSTGRWCGFGAAAARCWLEGRDPEVLARALAVSGIHAPLQSASAYSRMGHHTKEGIPWGTLTGLAAVELAAKGFVGPLDLWDHPEHFDRTRILEGFGEDWTILRTYFKPYACCRWLHAALDAWQDLALRGGSPREAEKVEIFTFQRAIRLNNDPDPATPEQAQFSLPFCLATVALEGPRALLPLSAGLLGRPDLIAFARKVSLHPDAALEKAFPAQAGARVVVTTERGVFSKEVAHPRGDPANPLSTEELEAKFHALAESRIDRPEAEALVLAVKGIRQDGLSRLSSLLTGPVG